MANKRGNIEAVTDFIFLGSVSLWLVTAIIKLKNKNKQQQKNLAPWKKS